MVVVVVGACVVVVGRTVVVVVGAGDEPNTDITTRATRAMTVTTTATATSWRRRYTLRFARWRGPRGAVIDSTLSSPAVSLFRSTSSITASEFTMPPFPAKWVRRLTMRLSMDRASSKRSASGEV